jgi:hypothetical protein
MSALPQTLLLDARCLPIDCYPWPKTVLHLATAKTKKHIVVLSEYSEITISHGNGDIRLPAVMRLIPGRLEDGSWTNRVVKRSNSVKFNRHNIFSRDGGICQYCGHYVSKREFTLDHIYPKSLGGPTTWENTVTCCIPCNQKKGGRTPEQAGMRLLSVPEKPVSTGPYFFGFYEQWMPSEWEPWLPAAPRDLKASKLYWYARLHG